MTVCGSVTPCPQATKPSVNPTHGQNSGVQTWDSVGRVVAPPAGVTNSHWIWILKKSGKTLIAVQKNSVDESSFLLWNFQVVLEIISLRDLLKELKISPWFAENLSLISARKWTFQAGKLIGLIIRGI